MTFPLRFVIVSKVMEMERIVEQTMLYDFYGELLTDHQKEIYEQVAYQDLSISEIAEQQGISRQGVFDLVRRCDRILMGYEERLHLIARFQQAKQSVQQIKQLAGASDETERDTALEQIAGIAEGLLEVL